VRFVIRRTDELLTRHPLEQLRREARFVFWQKVAVMALAFLALAVGIATILH
jgi:hypothetical protein